MGVAEIVTSFVATPLATVLRVPDGFQGWARLVYACNFDEQNSSFRVRP